MLKLMYRLLISFNKIMVTENISIERDIWWRTIDSSALFDEVTFE